MTRYDRRDSVQFIIKDIIGDIRTSDGFYRDYCRRQLSWLWARRHTISLDRYGWPVGMPDFNQGD